MVGINLCARATWAVGNAPSPHLFFFLTVQEKMDTPLGSSLLGALTFCAKQHGAGECDSKGLPLTLNTTNIVGKFERLKSLYHPNLTSYLEAKKLKNGKQS